MSSHTATGGITPSTNAGPREWWGLAILALPCLLYSMDLTVLNLAIPHITADLAPTGTQLLWIVDIYGFLLAGALVTMGAIGDRIGRRRLLMIGAVAFGIASLIAAFSSSAAMLIAARALLGLAAASLAPSTLSLIRTMFADERQRSFAIGVWMASFSVGGAIGPLVGGMLLQYFWWGSVFLISIPVMALLLVLGPLLLPEHRDQTGGRIDVPSTILSIVTMLTLVYGVKHFAIGDFSIASIGAVAVGLLLGWVFVARQGRLREPLIDLTLFRSAGFSGALAVNLAGFFLAFGTLLFLAQYLQLVLGMETFEAGIWTLSSAAGFVAGSLLAPSLLRWMRSSSLMAASLVLAAVGFGLLAAALWSGNFPLLMAASFLFSIGLAPVFTLSADLIVGSAPADKAGSAAAIAETSSELGGALGIAVLGSVLAAVYQQRLGSLIAGAVEADLAASLREGISSAVSALRDVDAVLKERLTEAVSVAYTDAFATVALVSLAVAVLAALGAQRLRVQS